MTEREFTPMQMVFLHISYGTLACLEPLEHAESAILTTQRSPVSTDLELMLERIRSKQITGGGSLIIFEYKILLFKKMLLFLHCLSPECFLIAINGFGFFE